MKKIYNWALVLITVLSTGFTLTSCDEDLMQANTLSGQWGGNFGMYYTDHWGREWDASFTVLEFYNNGWGASGTGQQCDYYDDGPFAYQYYRFNWRIDNGIITISYPGAHELDTEIYNYRMSYRFFDGYFRNTGSYFSLKKYSDPNWNRYSNYGDYYYYYNSGYYYDGYNYDDYYYPYDYYYAKTRSTTSDSVEVKPLVKLGNRFNEAGK